MATQIDPRGLDIEEQIVRIRKAQQEIDQISAETRKLLAESRVLSYATIFQGLIAIAALLGAGAAIAKLFFP
jgi:hypothetical protein